MATARIGRKTGRFLPSPEVLYRVHHTARPQGRAPLFLEGAAKANKAMADQILMPKATAVWLVDNTSMAFEQIADFCGLHPLEVEGLGVGEVERDMRGDHPDADR